MIDFPFREVKDSFVNFWAQMSGGKLFVGNKGEMKV